MALAAQERPSTSVVVDLSLLALKKTFCKAVSAALTKLAENAKKLIRGWDESGLSQAWGPQQGDLFKEAEALHAKKELFGGQNTGISKSPDDAMTEDHAADEKTAAAVLEEDDAAGVSADFEGPPEPEMAPMESSEESVPDPEADSTSDTTEGFTDDTVLAVLVKALGKATVGPTA